MAGRSRTIQKLLTCALTIAAGASLAQAQAQPTRPATAPAAAPADPLVSLNLPENAPLKVLIDYVSQEFGVNILYDDQVGNQRLTIKAPAKLPKSAVPALLDSGLRMKGLALIDAGQPGWKRVVPLQQAARVPGVQATADHPAVVMQVYK